MATDEFEPSGDLPLAREQHGEIRTFLRRHLPFRAPPPREFNIIVRDD